MTSPSSAAGRLAVTKRRWTSTRPLVSREEPLATGACMGTARDEPGIAGELAQIAADNKEVAGHGAVLGRKWRMKWIRFWTGG